VFRHLEDARRAALGRKARIPLFEPIVGTDEITLDDLGAPCSTGTAMPTRISPRQDTEGGGPPSPCPDCRYKTRHDSGETDTDKTRRIPRRRRQNSTEDGVAAQACASPSHGTEEPAPALLS